VKLLQFRDLIMRTEGGNEIEAQTHKHTQVIEEPKADKGRAVIGSPNVIY
jgi:hypothetical protein